MEWDDFYNAVKEQVEKTLKEKEVSEGALQVDKIMGMVLKKQLKIDGILNTKIIGRDLSRGEYGREVAYRPDSKIKIDGIRK